MKKIREIVRQYLLEARMVTLTYKMLSDIKRSFPNLKLLKISSHSSGTVALFRNQEDGNAYEIDIRPASHAQHADIWGDMLKPKNMRQSSVSDPNKTSI